MKHIETNIFELIQDKPRMVRIIGRRKAVDVFAELESALKEANLLPDEYFLLDNKFEDENRLVPDLRDVICYANRDGSEGIYLDVYLCGYDDVTDKCKDFILLPEKHCARIRMRSTECNTLQDIFTSSLRDLGNSPQDMFCKRKTKRFSVIHLWKRFGRSISIT